VHLGIGGGFAIGIHGVFEAGISRCFDRNIKSTQTYCYEMETDGEAISFGFKTHADL
jgi:hypothetical protein